MSWLSSPALAPPNWILPVAQPLADRIGLAQLGPTLHLALYSCVTSFALQKLSSLVSPLSKHYPKTKRKQDDWDLHIVSSSLLSLSPPLIRSDSTFYSPSPPPLITKLNTLVHSSGRLGILVVRGTFSFPSPSKSFTRIGFRSFDG